MWTWRDIEQYSVPLIVGVPNWAVADNLWGLLYILFRVFTRFGFTPTLCRRGGWGGGGGHLTANKLHDMRVCDLIVAMSVSQIN